MTARDVNSVLYLGIGKLWGAFILGLVINKSASFCFLSKLAGVLVGIAGFGALSACFIRINLGMNSGCSRYSSLDEFVSLAFGEYGSSSESEGASGSEEATTYLRSS